MCGYAGNLNHVIFYLGRVIKSIDNTIKSNKRFPSSLNPQFSRINSDQINYLSEDPNGGHTNYKINSLLLNKHVQHLVLI